MNPTKTANHEFLEVRMSVTSRYFRRPDEYSKAVLRAFEKILPSNRRYPHDFPYGMQVETPETRQDDLTIYRYPVDRLVKVCLDSEKDELFGFR